MWIELHRASVDDTSGEAEYKDIGTVIINPAYFVSAWDHLVRMTDFTIRVVETVDEIKQRMTVSQQMEEADGQSV